MAFWLAAVAMALAVASLLARAMLRGGDAPAEASDIDVYRDQLAEVERDQARGVIDASEADRLRLEVSRRLLDADRKRQSETRPRGESRRMTRIAAAGSACVVLAAGFGLYALIGAPGYPDLPIEFRREMAEEFRQNRVGQSMAEAEAGVERQAVKPEPRHAELMERLRAALAERPDDAEGYALLARNEAGLGNFVAARQAQERLLKLKGSDATVADWADYALLLVYAAGGYVSPEADRALAEVLRRDPSNGTARYLSGLLYAQTGRPDLAYRLWRPLLEESAPDAPWSAPIRARIADVAAQAGVQYRPPDAVVPPAADIASLPPEERQQMIRGMVEGLADRLARSGGPAEDWARLITALGVLGETGRAGAIYDEARDAFAASETDLALIESAAERAGIAE